MEGERERDTQWALKNLELIGSLNVYKCIIHTCICKCTSCVRTYAHKSQMVFVAPQILLWHITSSSSRLTTKEEIFVYRYDFWKCFVVFCRYSTDSLLPRCLLAYLTFCKLSIERASERSDVSFVNVYMCVYVRARACVWVFVVSACL